MPSDDQPDRSAVPRAIMRWVLAAFFAAAGIAHLLAPDALLAITPSWVPFAPQIIFLTGLCELAGAVALVTSAAALVGGRGVRRLCDLRVAGQFQTCGRRHRATAYHQLLVLSRAAPGVSACHRLVGAVLRQGDRLAVAEAIDGGRVTLR
jgi:DoxX-like family